MKRTPLKRTGGLKRMPMKRTSRRLRVKIDPEDTAWSNEVRARGGHWCQRCRVIRAEHAHHIIPRRFKATRLLEVNGISLCQFCHSEAHDNPQEFRDWLASSDPGRWATLKRWAAELKYRLRKGQP
jgi:5-methylcytosine-specific restriction endonuclease McrA